MVGAGVLWELNKNNIFLTVWHKVWYLKSILHLLPLLKHQKVLESRKESELCQCVLFSQVRLFILNYYCSRITSPSPIKALSNLILLNDVLSMWEKKLKKNFSVLFLSKKWQFDPLRANSRVCILQINWFSSGILKANMVYYFKIKIFTDAWYDWIVPLVII